MGAVVSESLNTHYTPWSGLTWALGPLFAG